MRFMKNIIMIVLVLIELICIAGIVIVVQTDYRNDLSLVKIEEICTVIFLAVMIPMGFGIIFLVEYLENRKEATERSCKD